ncbi:hypothetical protein Lal_00025721 [Lupinus albus]|nr:hypothetical protein Lal_00025721 [Lupinus albus]
MGHQGAHNDRARASSMGLILSTTLIMWKGLMCITGTESPVIVVLSGSMEPEFRRVSIITSF